MEGPPVGEEQKSWIIRVIRRFKKWMAVLLLSKLCVSGCLFSPLNSYVEIIAHGVIVLGRSLGLVGEALVDGLMPYKESLQQHLILIRSPRTRRNFCHL